jgi:hypothetical protein
MYLKKSNRIPRLLIQMTGLIGDKNLRHGRRKLLRTFLNPIKWFQPLYNQSIGINQPPDLMENGMISMCESCPDACVFEDNLVSSCRLDEYRVYGRQMNVIMHHEDADRRVEEKVRTVPK